MGHFLRRLTGFLTILLLALVAADFLLSQGAKHIHTGNMEIWKDIMDGKVDAELLILGNSRVNTDCDPDIISAITRFPTYDLGIFGHQFVVQHFRFGMFAQRNPQPRIAVQFLDPLFFHGSVSSFDAIQFLPWMWDMGFLRGMLPFGARFMLRESIPVWRYHGLPALLPFSREKVTRKGFYNYGNGEFHPDKQAVSFRKDERVFHLFRTFIQSLQEQGIHVILVFPPLHETFLFSPGAEEGIIRCCQELSTEFNIPFLDYRTLPMRKDSTLFIDSGHLNLSGARTFSDTLARDILRVCDLSY